MAAFFLFSHERFDAFWLAAADEVIAYDATNMAVELGNVKVMNIILLGTLSKMLDVDYDLWVEAIKKYVPAKQQEINIKAFDAGRNM